MKVLSAALSIALLATPAAAATMSSSGTGTILIYNPLGVPTFNPAAPSVACNAAAGTLVATVTASGGDGNPITWTMTGDTADFAIDAATGQISVGPNGITTADCGQSETVTVTATQP